MSERACGLGGPGGMGREGGSRTRLASARAARLRLFCVETLWGYKDTLPHSRRDSPGLTVFDEAANAQMVIGGGSG